MAGSDNLIVGDTFDDIYRQLLFQLAHYPMFVCSPRGSKINENLAVTLELNNPRARLLSCKKRNTNYGFAVGEFLWYWTGKQDLATMLYYNKRMKDYSDDGKTLNSAYGYRMRKEVLMTQLSSKKSSMELESVTQVLHGHSTQWEVAVQTLAQDTDSRRCVLHINRPFDQEKAAKVGSKDVPCTLSLQFFIRERKLHLHVHMRSNDVMWGLTYDLFSFTLFQELMLLELRKIPTMTDLELGKYYHTAGSLHLYEPHFQQAKDIVLEYGMAMDLQPPQEPIGDLKDLDEVIEVEEDLRTGECSRVLMTPLRGTPRWMIQQLNDHRAKRDAEQAKAT